MELNDDQNDTDKGLSKYILDINTGVTYKVKDLSGGTFLLVSDSQCSFLNQDESNAPSLYLGDIEQNLILNENQDLDNLSLNFDGVDLSNDLIHNNIVDDDNDVIQQTYNQTDDLQTNEIIINETNLNENTENTTTIVIETLETLSENNNEIIIEQNEILEHDDIIDEKDSISFLTLSDEHSEQSNDNVIANKFNKIEPTSSIVNRLNTIDDDVKIETREEIYKDIHDTIINNTKTSKSSHKVLFETEQDKLTVYMCNICGQIFEQLTGYQGHLRKHSKQYTWQCTQCSADNNVTFPRLSLLKQHIRQNHFADRKFYCELCGDKFVHASYLFDHLKSVHKSERNFKCPICTSSFHKKSDLFKHIRVHLNIKKYLCDICGKACADISNLNVHKRCHTGSKPYPCVYCGKRFKQINALNTHKASHNELENTANLDTEDNDEMATTSSQQNKEDGRQCRRYYCLVCGKTFQYRLLLKKHITDLHEKQKLFQCSECVEIYHNVHDFLKHSCISGSGDVPSANDANLNTENNEALENLLKEILNSCDTASNNEDYMNILMNMNVPVNENSENTNPDNMEPLPDIDAKEFFENFAASISSPSYQPSINSGIYTPRGPNEQQDQQLSFPPNEEETEIEFPSVLSSSDLNDYPITIDINPYNLEKLKMYVKTPKGEKQLSKILGKMTNKKKKNNQQDKVDNEIDKKEVKKSTVTKEPSLFCHLCGSGFTRNFTYKNHMKTVHSLDDFKKVYKCDQCNKVFAYMTGLNSHMKKIHPTDDKPVPYCCTFDSECKRTFLNKANLNNHIKRYHHKEKPFKCDFDGCSKHFFKKHDLKVHSLVHSREKPYFCEICPLRFRHSSHLFRHRRNIHNV